MRCLHSFFNQFIRIEKNPVESRIRYRLQISGAFPPAPPRGRGRGVGCRALRAAVLTHSTVSGVISYTCRSTSVVCGEREFRVHDVSAFAAARFAAAGSRSRSASTPLTSLQLLRDDACQIGLQSRPVQKTCSKVQSPQAHEVEPTLGIHRTMPTDAAFTAFCNLCQVTKSCCLPRAVPEVVARRTSA